ncbi:MAG: hypothetical protein ACTHMS_21645 [Jatrophihabitans sp.]|uniref:hypothetical protein n=1 Tax=Jatrophihabitans sp. TaxID=1932789 RepID=UPI003F7F2F21
MTDLVLPAFEMDCREWIVVSPDEAGLPEDFDGAPVLAALSSVVIGDSDLAEASGVLTVGLLDEAARELPTREVAPGSVAQELLDDEFGPESVRYVMPAPGQRLAVLAEFVPTPEPELRRRIEDLMVSFRWQTAAV